MKTSRLVNEILGRVGLRLQRVNPVTARRIHVKAKFYEPTSSCQIPELATLYRLYLGERNDGLFVEVGAYDGISFSNSSCLADVGWAGILIEPIPQFAQACRDRYRGNDRIQVIEAAVGDVNSNVEITIAGALSTINNDLLEGYQSIDWAEASFRAATRLTVPQRTLDEILDAARPQRRMDVLIVDVEGREASVFAGFSIERWTPRMIIAELSHTHPDLNSISVTDAELQRSIERRGYTVAYKDYINTVFVYDR